MSGGSERLQCCLILPLLVAASGLVSCVKVPAEAVTLSTVVGHRITAIQTSHERLAREYFDLCRENVEDFLVNRWVPEFMATFVRDANLMHLLENPEPLTEDQVQQIRDELQGSMDPGNLERVVAAVQSAFGDEERGQIAIEFAEAAVKQINRKRAELLTPLDQYEDRVLSEINGTYAELAQLQNSVTAFIQSARDVTVAQDSVLDRLKLLERRDAVLNQAMSLNDTIVSLTNSAESANAILEKIEEVVPGRRN